MPSAEFERLLKKLRTLPPTFGEDVAELRQAIDKAAEFFPIREDIVREETNAGGVPAEWLTPKTASGDGVLMYLHGGGYCMGSMTSHRHMIANIARAAGVRALSIGYRLSPEHPFPAGLDDAVTAYRWLVEEGTPPKSLVIGGDSAGGGLTLATLLKLREDGLDQPAGAVLISPWTGLTSSGDSIRTQAASDPILNPDRIGHVAQWYADAADLTLPLISPLFADLSGLPPLFVQVGSAEVLLDDSTRLAQAARDQGLDLELEVWEDMFHVWHYYADWIPEGREAIEKIAQFMSAKLAG